LISDNSVVSNEPFTTKYRKINNDYLNDNTFCLGISYGLLRQHNFLTAKAGGSDYTSYLDITSFNKFLNFNSRHNYSFQQNTINIKNGEVKLDPNTLNTLISLNTLFKNQNKIFNYFLNYPLFLSKVMTDNNKLLTYPWRKFSNINNFFNKIRQLELNKNLTDSDFSLTKLNNFRLYKVFNYGFSNIKVFDPRSINQSFLPSDQSLRQYRNLELNTINVNFSSNFTNLPTYSNLNLYSYYNTICSNFINTNKATTLFSNKTYFELPFSPISSNNSLLSNLNYDTSCLTSDTNFMSNNKLFNLIKVRKLNDVYILRGKRDGAPKFLNNAY